MAEGSVLEAPLEHELDSELQDKLLKHPGRWVAITRSRLIAVGDSSFEVLQAARAQGFLSPILFLVPRDEKTAYFF